MIGYTQVENEIFDKMVLGKDIVLSKQLFPLRLADTVICRKKNMLLWQVGNTQYAVYKSKRYIINNPNDKKGLAY